MNREAFFAHVRAALFNHQLSTAQVEGCEAILAGFEAARWPLSWAAYGFATVFHETGQRMQPIIETTGPRDREPVSVDRAIARLEAAWAAKRLRWVKTAYWRKDKDGLSWLGRGLPQTTHRTNYAWAERVTGVPFTRNPELMLEMRYSLPVMIQAMQEGAYTRHRNADYLNRQPPDYRGARRIINGMDKADMIAGYARRFEEALRLAGYGRHKPAPAPERRASPSPLPPSPNPDTPAPAPRPSLWQRIRSALATPGG